eukprot:SAG31_NODE_7506_length_1669_cov_2.182166_3_plen_113_part_00
MLIVGSAFASQPSETVQREAGCRISVPLSFRVVGRYVPKSLQLPAALLSAGCGAAAVATGWLLIYRGIVRDSLGFQFKTGLQGSQIERADTNISIAGTAVSFLLRPYRCRTG